MLRKRLIFTLLYGNGKFHLSRNFRLQSIGDINWLEKNYNFAEIAHSIDELIVLDVSRENRDVEEFCSALKALAKNCFIPMAAGGGVHNLETAQKLLNSGADKIVLNSSLYANDGFVESLSNLLGEQSIVASLDVKTGPLGEHRIWTNNGSIQKVEPAEYWISYVSNLPIGELYLNSMEKDGTGNGFEMDLLDILPTGLKKPVILAGGAGNYHHLLKCLNDERVDAVATANLLNFVGDGLTHARASLLFKGVDLPIWKSTLGHQKSDDVFELNNHGD